MTVPSTYDIADHWLPKYEPSPFLLCTTQWWFQFVHYFKMLSSTSLLVISQTTVKIFPFILSFFFGNIGVWTQGTLPLEQLHQLLPFTLEVCLATFFMASWVVLTLQNDISGLHTEAILCTSASSSYCIVCQPHRRTGMHVVEVITECINRAV
jgi:ABC-type antimicrobial peptide transport system permease subunit